MDLKEMNDSLKIRLKEFSSYVDQKKTELEGVENKFEYLTN